MAGLTGWLRNGEVAPRSRAGGLPSRLCFLQRWGAGDSCSAGLPSHLRRFPLNYKTSIASAESMDPKRDRLVESHLSKNERWARPRPFIRRVASTESDRKSVV